MELCKVASFSWCRGAFVVPPSFLHPRQIQFDVDDDDECWVPKIMPIGSSDKVQAALAEIASRMRKLTRGFKNAVKLCLLRLLHSYKLVASVLKSRMGTFSFTWIKQLKEKEESAKQNKTLKKLLQSANRDYVISNDDKKVYISEIEGKTVGLYFTVNSYPPCIEFTEKLIEMYNSLKENGESFEIVMIYLDDNDKEFKFGNYISYKR